MFNNVLVTRSNLKRQKNIMYELLLIAVFCSTCLVTKIHKKKLKARDKKKFHPN